MHSAVCLLSNESPETGEAGLNFPPVLYYYSAGVSPRQGCGQLALYGASTKNNYNGQTEKPQSKADEVH